ncbi:MAG: Asp23/Gls24 family envelope stress response protein [Anaerolineae bacterium]
MPSDQDRVIVHPRVLSTIAALTALSVPGVARLRPSASLAAYLLHGRRGVAGVGLRTRGDSAMIDLHLVINAGFGLLEVSRRVQAAVTRAVTEMTDMQVRQVDVYVDGVRTGTYS